MTAAIPRLRWWAAWILLAMQPAWAGEAPAHAHAQGLNLHDDVEWLDPSRAEPKRQGKAATFVADHGNVSVLSVDGDYSRGLSTPRLEVARRFYATHPDEFDFLIAFTTFEFPTAGATAFYNPVRNEVRGIGAPVFEHNAQYGSASKLQGYIDMAALSRYDFNTRSPEFGWPLAVLTHEIMHRWSVFVRYATPEGAIRPDLIGRDGAHWSLLASTEASIMYGARWTEATPGRWRIAETRERLGMWDLYLGGMADISEMSAIDLIRAPGIDPGSLPGVGFEVDGIREQIQPEQIIAAEGPRIPNAAQSQRVFDAALILLLRPGETVDPIDLARLERFRVAYESYFQSITRGRATIRIHLRPMAAHTMSAPLPLTASVIAPRPQPLDAAATWLRSRQFPDGHWQDRPGTAARDTAAALALLAETSPNEVPVLQAREWLRARQPLNRDESSWVRTALPEQSSAPQMLNADGGQGLLTDWPSSPLDSLRGLVASDAAHQRDESALASMSAYLQGRQNPDGSFGPSTLGAGRVMVSALSAEQLLRRQTAAEIAAGTRARAWVLETVGEASATTRSLADNAELSLRGGALQLPDSIRAALVSHLLSRQGQDGDWGGSVYTTAVTALALLRELRPNLVPITAVATPGSPVVGDLVRLRLRLRNSGGRTAPASTLRWFAGDPLQGAAALGDPILLPPLQAGDELERDLWFESATLVGDRTLFAVLDADAQVEEGREDDNVLTLPIRIAAAPNGVDLAVEARDMSFVPTVVTRVPSSVQLRGTLRNVGSVGAAQVLVRAIHLRADGEQIALAETRIDVAGASQAPFELALPITLPQTYQVRVIADADQAIAEVREENNIAQFTLPFADAVDFELVGASLVVEPSAAVVGDDVRVRITVANRGTSDAPASVLALEQEIAGSWQRVAHAVLNAAASQEVTREIVWRPTVEGPARLRLHADPEALVAETDESNNIHAFDLTVGRSDDANLVVVANSLVVTPVPVLQGAPLQMQASVRNVGATAATGFNLALYRGDPRSGGERLGVTRIADGLASQSERIVSVEVADYTEHGDASFFVFVDSEGEVTERNETDNFGVTDITALALPDLAVSLGSITLTPSAPVIGQPVLASIVVSNLGEQASMPVQVRLSEIAGAQRAEVAPMQYVPSIAPGATHQSEWSWTFGQIDGVQALSLEVDRDNQVRESNESNNEATLLLDTQSGDAFTTEPYFSPNGDGVKDQTRVVWRNGVGIEHVAVLDHSGRERRRIEIIEDAGGGAASVLWDGRDDAGSVVNDGRYGVAARYVDGRSNEPVYVTLDIDRPMALEAANTQDGVYRALPASINPWIAMPEGSPAEDYAFAVGDAGNVHPATQRGVFRSHTLLGGVEPVLSARWLDSYAQTNGLVALEPVHIDALPDGRLLIAAHEMGGANRTLLFTMAPNDIDKPMLAANVESRVVDPLIGRFDAQRWLVGDRNQAGVRWVVDLAAGSAVPLRENDPVGKVLVVMADGAVLANPWRNGMDFIPVDAAGAIVALPALYDSTATRTAFSDDGRSYLQHEQSGGGSLGKAEYFGRKGAPLTCDEDREGGRERVSIVNVATAQRTELICVNVPYFGGGSDKRKRHAADSGNWNYLRMLRAFWLEQQREVVVIDHAGHRVLRFADDGNLLGEIALPSILRQGPYAAEAASTDGDRISVLTAEPSTPTSAHSSWLDRASALLGFEQRSFDANTRSLYLTTGELLLANGGSNDPEVYEGAVDYLRVDADGVTERLAGSTVSPLADAGDVDAYPLLQIVDGQTVAPAAWPSFIHRNGTLLQRDGRIRIPSQGRLTAPWSFATRLRATNRGQTRVDLASQGADSNDQRTRAYFNTLEKLTATLNASSDGRTVRLSGIATDRNFDHFLIDWAFASHPDQWNALVPATRDPIRFDDFIGWAPPQAGAYLFRLRVVDRAGNSRENLATAEVEFGSPIINVRQDYRYISPNNDGAQDAVTVRFVVARPTEQRFEVRDFAGRVIRREDRVFGTPELGANTWVWDGRTDVGAVASEGRYRIELSSGFVLRVNLDVTAPTVAATLSMTGDQFDQTDFLLGAPIGKGPVIEFSIRDEFEGRPGDFQLRRLESSPTAASEWTPLFPYANFTTEQGVEYGGLSSAQYSGHRFRAVAVDAAGNRTVRPAGNSQAGLMLVHVDQLREKMPKFQLLPYGTSEAIPTYQNYVVRQQEKRYFTVPIPASAEVPLFALDLKGELVELSVDELTPDSSTWVTRRTAAASLPPDPVPSGLVGHVRSITVDLRTKRPGEYVTLRLRGRYPDGSEQVSNATRILIGGIVLEKCPTLADPRFLAQSFLLEPTRDFQLDFSEDKVLIKGRVPGEYFPEARLATFPALATRERWFRASAVDGQGRQSYSGWLECLDGVGGGEEDGGSGPGTDAIQVLPSFAAECQEVPTGKVRAQLILAQRDAQYRVVVRSPFLAAPFLHEVLPGTVDAYQIDVSSWPEAEYSARLERRASQSEPWNVVGRVAPFTVDHTPPTVEISAPANGTRMCANAQPPATLVASVDDERRAGFIVESRVAGSNGRFVRNECDGYSPINPNLECKRPDFISGRVSTFTGRMPLDFVKPLPSDDNGRPIELRLRASDWSGAQVCRTVQYTLDATVRIEERSAPLPLLPDSRPAIAGIAPGSSGAYRRATWFLRTRESVQLSVALYRAQPASNAQGYVTVGGSVAALASVLPVNGEHDFAWDGLVGGNAQADGIYAIRFHAVDECGNEATLDRFVVVDGTPPAIQITRPAPAAQLRVATLQIGGTATDPIFDRYRVEISQAAANGPWQTLVEESRSVPVPTVLTQWPTNGALGPVWVRLSANDKFGNAGDVVHAIELLPRSLVMQDVRVEPALFSPNDDARLDETTLAIELRRAALLDVTVLDANDVLIRRLATASATPVGTMQIVWNGRRDSGQVVADGEYRIEARAVDAALPESVDTQQVSVVIDTVAPLLSSITPTTDFVSCNEAASFDVDDDHLDRFEARLRQDGATVVEHLGRARGYHVVAPFFGRTEGAYRLDLDAYDLAANHAVAQRDFTLDCTEPSAALTLPAEDAVVPRLAGTLVPIRGTASDAHLQRYVLDLAPAATPQSRNTLFEGTASVQDGLLFDWQPTQPDGDYILRLQTEDRAGNVTEVTRLLRIDGTPPVADIYSPETDAFVQRRTEMHGVASDSNFKDYQVQIATPAQAAQNQWSTVTVDSLPRDGRLADLILVNEGELDLRLVVTDLAGLVSTDQIRVRVDGQPPPAPLSLTAALEDRRNVRLNWQGSEVPDLAGFAILRNGQRITPDLVPSRSHVDTDVPEGELSYVVIAYDHAGNASAPSNAVRLRVDRTPPEVALFTPASNERIRGVYAITGVAFSDNDFAEYVLSAISLDGSDTTVLRRSAAAVSGGALHTWDTRLLTNETTLRLHLRTLDASGNEASTEVRVVVDNEAPAAPTDLIASGSETQVSVAWAPNVESDLLGYLLYRGGQLIGYGGSLPSDLRPLAISSNAYSDVDAPDGVLTYRVYAIDRAGNISEPSVPAQLTRDVGPPHLEFVRPQAGEEFSQAIELLAHSDDRDIAQVVFSFRAAGAGAWTDIGNALTQAPWRATFEPGTAPYGNYELRALAIDVGGLSDPQPPLVTVRYADLDPPPTPSGLRARADGNDVGIEWTASVASDLAGYRIERETASGTWQLLQPALITATEVIDPARDRGEHRYRVIAVDSSDNASPASTPDSAQVFGLSTQQPYTPTSQDSITLHGRALDRGGALQYRVLGESETHEAQGAEVVAGAEFTSAALPVFLGENRIDVRILDAQGNRSVPSLVQVRRGAVPLPPTALTGVVDMLNVALSWQPSPSADVAGYRVYRNGQAMVADAPLAHVISAQTHSGNTPGLVDENPLTHWSIQAPVASAELGSDGRVDLSWTDVALVSGLRLHYASAFDAAHDYRVLAFDAEAGWIPVGTRSERSAQDELMLLDTPYPTNRLRIELQRARAPGARVRLLDLQLLQRTPLAATVAEDQVAEGRHVYEVSAVSALGFESERSPNWTAQIGDVEAPPAVVLTGSVTDGDATLEWSESIAPDLQGYVVIRDGLRIAQVPAAQARRYVDAGLSNGAYIYAVIAEDNHFNASPRSNEVALQVATGGPGQPTITSVTQAGAEFALRVVWSAGIGASPVQYKLYVSAAENDPAAPYQLLLNLDESEYVHRGLSAGARRYYRVQATDARGNVSELSAPRGGQVLDTAPPDAPRITYPTLPGQTLPWSQPRFDVCGVTSPGADVIIARNGAAIGETRARTSTAVETLSFAADGARIGIAADGRSVFMARSADDTAPGWFDLAAGLRIGTRPSEILDLRMVRVLSGARTVLASTASGWIVSFPYGEAPSEELSYFGDSIDDFAPDATAARLLIAGVHHQLGAGLWLWRAQSGDYTPVVLPLGRVLRTGSLRWSADGRSAVFADNDGRVYRMHGETLAVTEIGASATAAGPLPAPQGDRWLAIDAATRRLLRVDADGAAPDVLVNENRPMLAAAWSPDGDRVAVRFLEALEIRDAQSGVVLESIAAAALSEGPRYELQWSASWKLLFTADLPDRKPELWQVAGAFCARNFIALPGSNMLEAVAENQSGVLSLPSAPVEIDYALPAARNIDLDVRAEDLRVFPAGARVGDQLVAYATVRNLGTDEMLGEAGAVLSASFRRPDGSVLALVVDEALSVDAGGITTVTFDLGPVVQVGDYTLGVEADSSSRVVELREDNNVATRTWRIDNQAQPQLGLSAQRATWAPGEVVRGEVEVSNPGATFNGEVVLEARDSSGSSLGEILRQPIAALAAGQNRRYDWQWSPGDVIAGAYSVHASLRTSNGQELVTRSAALNMEARVDLSLFLEPASVSAVIGTPLPIRIGVEYRGGNVVLDAGVLKLEARDASGALQTLWQGPSGVLLPGYSVRRSVDWPVAMQSPGDYSLRLVFVSGEVEKFTARNVSLRAAQTLDTLSGELSIAPAPQVILGSAPAVINANVRNPGATALSGVQLRLRVLAEGVTDPLLEQTWTAEIGAGATTQQAAALGTLAELPNSYVAVLQARLPGDAVGSWRALDSLGFASVDGLGPQIALVAPASSRPHRSPVALAARISDRHSRVEQAAYRVDGGEWRSLSAGGIEGYEALLHGLADGDHSLALRALDLWGNETVSEGFSFTADSTAPTIRIEGVVDGALINQSVTPTITIEDAHPEGYSAWLDDVPFVTATEVTSDGLHRLRVVAIDTAGNRAERALQFTIDRTPPVLSILSPNEGARTTADTIEVRTASEAAATVRIVVGGYSAELTADSNGDANFAAVPLVPGQNLIQALARDSALNASDPVSVGVTRDVLSGELSGQLVLAVTQLPRGQNLDLEATLDNGTPQAFAALPLRLRAIDAAGANLYDESVQVAIASGATLRLPRVLEASAWTWGPVTLTLEADVGQGYQILDAATVTVVDVSAPQLLPLAPAAASVQTRPTALRVSVTDDRAVSDVAYRIDAGVWRSMEVVQGSQFGASVDLADGPHAVQFRAFDLDANEGQSASVNFVVDTTPPQFSVSGVADGEHYEQAVTPIIEVLDANPSSMSLRLNEAPYVSGTPVSSSGEYQLDMQAEDAAGNHSERSLSFEIDVEPPSVIFSAPQPEAIIATERVLVLGSSKPGASIRLTTGAFEAVVIASATGSFSVNDVPLSVGQNLLSARATDSAGRLGPVAELRVFHTPGNPSGLGGSLIAIPHTLPAGDALQLQFAVTDLAGAARAALPLRIELRSVGADNAAHSRTRTIDLGAGQTFTATESIDSTGLAFGEYVARLEAQVEGQWRELAADALQIVDAAAPQVTLLAPAAASVHRDAAQVRARVTDQTGVESVQVRVDAGDWERMTALPDNEWQRDITLPREGSLLIEVRADDTRGNRSTPQSVIVVSDVSPPQIDIGGVSEGQVSRLALTPTVHIEDASATTSLITLDGLPFVSGTAVSTEGEHVLRVDAEDVVGNRSQRRIDFRIDTTLPETLFVQPLDGANVAASSIDVLGRTEAHARVQFVAGDYTRELDADASGAFVLRSVPLRDGLNTLRARATDSAGNIGNWAQIAVRRGCGTAELACGIFRDGFEPGIGDRILRDGIEFSPDSKADLDAPAPSPEAKAASRAHLDAPLWLSRRRPTTRPVAGGRERAT